MTVLTCTEPGKLDYSERPGIPLLQPGQAILKIRRIGVCGTDLHAYAGTQPFFQYPRILGHEIAADLVAVDGNDGFVPGEAVTILPYFSCGHCIACRNGKPNCCVSIAVCGVHVDGAMVEYLSVPATSLVKSAGLGYDELALVEPFAIGAHGIGRAQVQKDEYVLVMGAGPIGLGTMAFAAIAGARVIALDVNAERLGFCTERLGVPHTINAAREDVASRLRQITGNDMPTVVIDATGNQQAINNALPWLGHGGRFVLIGLQKKELIFSHPEFHKRETTLMSSRNATHKDFTQVIGAMKSGLVDARALISHRIPFQQAKYAFEHQLHEDAGVIKAMIEMN